jgi:hypothetical protein
VLLELFLDLLKAKIEDYDLVLMTMHPAKTMEVDRVREVLKNNNNKPILIKRGAEISLCGYSDKTWKLAILNNQFFLDISFPKVGETSMLYSGQQTDGMRQEISSRSAHNPSECAGFDENNKKILMDIKTSIQLMIKKLGQRHMSHQDEYETLFRMLISAKKEKDPALYKPAIHFINHLLRQLKEFKAIYLDDTQQNDTLRKSTYFYLFEGPLPPLKMIKENKVADSTPRYIERSRDTELPAFRQFIEKFESDPLVMKLRKEASVYRCQLEKEEKEKEANSIKPEEDDFGFTSIDGDIASKQPKQTKNDMQHTEDDPAAKKSGWFGFGRWS